MFSFSALVVVAIYSKLVSGYLVVLTGDGDVLPGEDATFKAEVFEENGMLSSHEYTFDWWDSANHSATINGRSPVYWNVTYDIGSHPGLYNVTVKVIRSILLLKTTVGTESIQFKITKFLEGEVMLRQGNFTRKKFISNDMPVNHTILLKDPFLNFLNKTKNFMRLFWFVDCVYYGPHSGLEFDFNYTKKVDAMHFVEAMLIASYDPKLSKEYSIFSPQRIQTMFNVSGDMHNLSNVTKNSTSINATRGNITETMGDDIDQTLMEWLSNFNASRANTTAPPSNYCLDPSIIPISPKYTYGFFRTNLTVKAPVKISPINGTNWLMDGEILNITVACNGSSPYTFCVLLKSGLYNITGNETCKEETVVRNCSFGVQHLFKKPSEYTLVVIISNAVSRVIKPIAVNIYKVKKHAQLSVIIVPVSFSLIATILIIFGVAYYVQSKHRYTIEVADFDFGNQTSNMEYKTFRERLRESISNSFLKSNDYEDDDSSWSESVPTSRKYGSMQ